MTKEEREEAIRNIKEHCYFASLNSEAKEALDMAIEALNQEPCDKYITEIDHLRKYISKLETQIVEQEPCEDAISREDTMTALRADSSFICSNDKLNAIRIVEGMPPATSQPKIGHWVRWYEIIEKEYCTIHDPHCKCSECNREYEPYIASSYNYCPNCGCRFVETQESYVISKAESEKEMKIIFIEYNGTEHHVNCVSFEFRTNQVSNWVKIKYKDGRQEMIHEIATIKSESEDNK